MGRNKKIGLDYFPFDIGFFQDLKIRKLIKYQGGKAVTVYALLLCNIYKQGYYMRWDEELPFIVSEQTGFEEVYIREVIKCCLVVGLFSKELYESDKVITSRGIQERYITVCELCRRKVDISSEFMLISSEEINVSSEEIMVSSEDKPINSSKSTQRKEKENRKKNKTKENSTNVEEKKADQVMKLAAAKAATLKRRDEFYDSLVLYVERYGKEMIRAFFDYWSELNRSKTKMRFEQQPTWEVAKRLATWSKREKFNGKSSNSIQATGAYIAGRTAQDKAASRQSLENLADAILGQH